MIIRVLSAALLVWSLVFPRRIASAQEQAKPRADAPPATASSDKATCVPTFHCLGIYWSPDAGQARKKVLVKFRDVAEKTWHDGLPMRYNPVKTPECKGDYRGSIVNLTPGTAYEIALTLEGTDTRTTLNGATWNETFPVASTVKCKSGATTLPVEKSGSPEGY